MPAKKETVSALPDEAWASAVLSTLASIDSDELAVKLQRARFGARPTDTFQTGPEGESLTYQDRLDELEAARKRVVVENEDIMPAVRELIAARTAG